MTQYFVDPATVDLADFTLSWNTGVASLTRPGSALRFTITSNARVACSYDPAGTAATEYDILLEVTPTYSGGVPANINFGAGGHISGNASTSNAYGGIDRAETDTRNPLIISWEGGSFTNVTGSMAGVGSVKYWVRFRVDAAGDQFCRTWIGAIGDEPVSFQISRTTPPALSAGGLGFIMFREGTYDVSFFSIGTGGDVAPTTAPGGVTLITTDVNALLQKQRTLTSSINAQLTKNIAATLDADAVLAKGRTLITDIDGYLQKRVLITTDADAILGALSTVVTQADAYLQRSVSVLTDIDALLTAPQTAQINVDSILQLKNEVTTTVEALLSKTRVIVTAADAVLLEAGVTAITTEVNALLSKMRSIAITSDALLRKGFQTQTTIDSVLQIRSTLTALVNAVIQKTQFITLLADSVLFDADAGGFQGTAGGFNLSQPSVNFAAARSVSFGASRSFILDNPRGFRRSS